MSPKKREEATLTAAEFRRSVTIPAVPEQVRAARVFVARVLGESRVDSDVVLSLASELVTNSALHSGSAVPGGVVTVTVAVGDEVIGRGHLDHVYRKLAIRSGHQLPTALSQQPS